VVSVNDVTVMALQTYWPRGQSVNRRSVDCARHYTRSVRDVTLYWLAPRSEPQLSRSPLSDVLPSAYLLNCPAAALTPDRTILLNHVFRNENKTLRVDNGQRQA